MSEINLQTPQQERNYTALIFYKSPKKYHDEIVQINKKSYDLFKDHGHENFQVFQLRNSNTFEGEGMNAFINITNLIPVNEDEELWVELHSYGDIEHAKEIMAKCEKDERMRPIYERFMKIISPGTKMIMGDFNGLNLQ